MFGQDGKNGLVTFTEREDRACEATGALARGLIEEHLAQEEAKEPGVRVDCPICGGPVMHESIEQAALDRRELQTRRGKIEYERAARRRFISTPASSRCEKKTGSPEFASRAGRTAKSAVF